MSLFHAQFSTTAVPDSCLETQASWNLHLGANHWYTYKAPYQHLY